MRQKYDIAFQILLTRIKSNKFQIEDVVLLNSCMTVNLSFCNSFDSVIIVQFNQTKHMINRFQMKRFARVRNSKIFLFFVEHFRIKKNDNNLIQNDFFMLL